MRLTLETTSSDPLYSWKVVIEDPLDDLDVHEQKELFRRALLAASFHPSSVDGALGEEE